MSAPRSRTGADRGSDRDDRFRLAALLIVLSALAVRAIAFWRVPELTYDGTYYLRQAERLSHFRYDWIGFPPGYPLAVLCARAVAHDAVLAGRLVSLAAGFLSLWLVHRLARRHLSPVLAWVVVAVLAVHPHLARVQVETLSESLYLALTLAGLLGFETRRDLLAGSALGAAFLVRPESVLLLAGLMALRAWRDRRVPWRLAVGLVPVVAYSALASHAVRQWVVSPKQGQIDWGPAVLSRLATLGQALHACFPVVLLPGAILWGVRRSPQFLLPVLYVLTIPFFAVHVQERLLLPALPFLLVLGVGWAASLNPLWRRPVVVAAGLLLLIGALPGARNLAGSGPLTPRAREIGAALRPHLQFEDRVAGRFPVAAYFAGAGFVRAPRAAPCTALLDSVRAAGATHLLVLECEMRNVLPQLRPLFEDARFATSEGRLRPVASVDAPPGSRAILYRFEPPVLGSASVQIEAQGIASSVWVRGRWLAATTTGALVWLPGGEPAAAAPEPVLEIAVDSTASRVVCTLRRASSTVLATLEMDRGTWTVHPATESDSPVSPAFAADAILYVSRSPAGLRALDLRTGRVRQVELEGVTSAQGTPERVSARGQQVAITYVPASREKPESRVVATAHLPLEGAGDPLVLQGRWATGLRLFHPGTCWTSDGRGVLASVLLTESGGGVASEQSSVCVLEPGGFTRRLSFGLDRARQPALAPGRIAILTGDGALCSAPLSPTALVLPPPRTFEAVLAPVVPPPR